MEKTPSVRQSVSSLPAFKLQQRQSVIVPHIQPSGSCFPQDVAQTQQMASHQDELARKRGLRDSKKRKCLMCARTFSKAEHLERHVRSHTKEKPFQCRQCGRKYGRKYVWGSQCKAVADHLVIHCSDTLRISTTTRVTMKSKIPPPGRPGRAPDQNQQLVRPTMGNSQRAQQQVSMQVLRCLCWAK